MQADSGTALHNGFMTLLCINLCDTGYFFISFSGLLHSRIMTSNKQEVCI